MADQNTTNPTPGEITIMAAGVVALIFSFFDFYKVPSVSVRGFSGGGGGVSAWGSGLFPTATLMVIFVIIMAVQIAVARFSKANLPSPPLGFTWEQIHIVLGFFAALYAVAFLVVSKGGLDFGVGFWFILAACIAALVGAILLQRERATSPPSA